MSEMKYPFVPKSNKSLKIGDYWLIKLESGKYSIGIVLDIPPAEYRSRTEFVAGLLNWKEFAKPEIEKIKNFKILKQGKASVKTIKHTGREIAGNINLELHNIECLEQKNQTKYSEYTYVIKGYKKIKKMERKDSEKYETLGTWGYNFIKVLAENI